MRKTLHPKLLAAAVAATIAIPTSAQSVLEEVVVVAQKREQNVQDVPIAITAFTGEQMNAPGVSESFDTPPFLPVFTSQVTWRVKTLSSRFVASPRTTLMTSSRHRMRFTSMRVTSRLRKPKLSQCSISIA